MSCALCVPMYPRPDVLGLPFSPDQMPLQLLCLQRNLFITASTSPGSEASKFGRTSRTLPPLVASAEARAPAATTSSIISRRGLSSECFVLGARTGRTVARPVGRGCNAASATGAACRYRCRCRCCLLRTEILLMFTCVPGACCLPLPLPPLGGPRPRAASRSLTRSAMADDLKDGRGI